MRKIMFNDKYGLTQAVLDRRKTMTRRTVKLRDYYDINKDFNVEYDTKTKQCCLTQGQMIVARSLYSVGEIVAIAQSYATLGKPIYGKIYNNKMFVKAEDMPHHIRIKNITAEWLQDISNDDCIVEGIIKTENGYQYCHESPLYRTARGAFATLIDKVGKKGDWKSNPFVWVYEFELVD